MILVGFNPVSMLNSKIMKLRQFQSTLKVFSSSEVKRNTLLSVGANLCFALLGFAGIALLSRSLTIEDFGIWMIYLSASSMLEMIRIGFVQTALVRFASHSDQTIQQQYLASGWVFAAVFSLSIALMLGLLAIFIPADNAYSIVVSYYPFLMLANLPQLMASAYLQAQMKVKQQLLIKAVNLSLSCLTFVLAYRLEFSVETLVLLQVLVNVLTSLWVIAMNWSGLRFIRQVQWEKIKELMHFGKFTIGTLLGTNLLKSADTIILALSLDPSYAALYGVPLKATETFEIILRSVLQLFIPKLSKASLNNQTQEMKRLFQNYAGLITILYVPLMILCFCFAKTILFLLAGEKYVMMAPVFQVFTLYGMLLPIDRFSGVTLDCMNLPNYNLKKTSIMVVVNICLDLLILQFTSDLKWIALGTCFTTLTGMLLGIHFLNYRFQTTLSAIVLSGWNYWKSLPQHLHKSVS